MTDHRLPIQTQHCRFCNHLLLATTRNISTLPRRGGEGKDKALILPLERKSSTDADADIEADLKEEAKTTETEPSSRKTRARHVSNHTTLLLATTIPDRRATIIRREDGIEKRILLRCGRCKVVVGYYLDRLHWASTGDHRERGGARDGEEEEERPPAVYLLPGAVVETEKLGGEGVGEREWREWVV
ncbi:uncharacterized protein N7518_007264 [Penicillium psychrosexuale]|uniref:uncharacterized protein n=1 Tax=Penicillium psychrosexuale TaxID=1002107 RepID=UPI0025452165|nr:uncharacterized protein N7518_007264 [Penicillium psychrosexuale]KAJ5790253.1 hypothetical protein N7518_007264 [Penicillium psychrosexuale]